MNAIYWGLTALCIMGHQDALDREEMIEFVMSCWDEEAGSVQPSCLLFIANMADSQAVSALILIMTRISCRHSVQSKYSSRRTR